ncbi:Maternal effect protein staufen [Gryllus bimaculatus]|nr:Maternal effect protein staufen [Gryllus bimaculatus]
MVEFPSCFGQPSAHSSTSTSFFCADPRRLALLRGVPDLRARAIAAGQRSRTRSSATAPRPPRRTADLCVCWRQREVDGKSVSRVENHFQTQMWQPPSPKRARSEVSDLLEKNMTVACVGKTPVSVLQELLSRRGTTPRYELVQIEGAIHEPTFRYRVTVADVVAMGTGRSKKEAKHAAAKALLDKMIVGPGDEGSIPVGNSNTMPEVKNEIVSPYDDKIPGNPIGSLQEMCMSRRWPPPSYEMVTEEGLPHERLFTIACTVFKQRELGTGKSKKLAKRMAAHKMWEKLQDAPIASSNMPTGLEDDDEIAQRVANMAARYADLKDSKISTLTTSHSHKVSQFHKNLKLSSGEKLSELQNKSLNDATFNFVQFLQEIASEQQFEVTYVDIEENDPISCR